MRVTIVICYKIGHQYQHLFLQVRDFFDVKDDPVLGFSPPAVVTVFHTHVWEGTIDYRFVVQVLSHSTSVYWSVFLFNSWRFPFYPKFQNVRHGSRRHGNFVGEKSENC